MLAPLRSASNCPALVLNADYRPLSYYPLSLWSWQDAIKAVFLERVNILEEYDRVVRSARFEMRLPSVVSLKTYIKPARHPAFTRFNVFLRDRFECQYCGDPKDLTFDHVIPRSRGGRTTWENVITACSPCNLQKGGRLPASGWHASAPSSASAHGDRIARARPQISAELSARVLGGLSVLGFGAGTVARRCHCSTQPWRGHPRRSAAVLCNAPGAGHEPAHGADSVDLDLFRKFYRHAAASLDRLRSASDSRAPVPRHVQRGLAMRPLRRRGIPPPSASDAGSRSPRSAICCA